MVSSSVNRRISVGFDMNSSNFLFLPYDPEIKDKNRKAKKVRSMKSPFEFLSITNFLPF